MTTGIPCYFFLDIREVADKLLGADMIQVTCPHCSQPSMVEDYPWETAITCCLCGEEFLSNAKQVSGSEERRKIKRMHEELPFRAVIGKALVGLLLIGVLVGGGWGFWYYQELKKEKANLRSEKTAEYQRRSAEREEARRRNREDVKERARLAEERARMEREVEGGLTFFVVEARALYMDAWAARGLETNEKLALLEKWPDRVDELNADPRAKIDLEEKGLVGTDLRRMMSTWMNSGIDDDWTEKTTAKWDEVFGLRRGAPSTEEQVAQIKQQEVAAEAKIVAMAKAEAEAFLSTKSSSSFAGDGGYELEAWVFIQTVVEARLTSPKSADFPSGGHRSVKSLGGGRYGVKSYVEATNSFGATGRINFECVVEEQGGGRFTLISLEM